LLAEQIAGHGRDELVAQLTAADVPAGPVNQVSEALEAMEAAHDGAWTQAADGMRLAPDPIRVDGERLPLRAAPPRLGEHTDAILEEAGVSPAEIVALRLARVIG
jgi:crotonobetainyl-CoA:carnitine CoA-transferase CaiB-like acyl-CoA transferase